MLNLVRSRACPSIIGLVLFDSDADNLPAIKLTMSGQPRIGPVPESQPGAMFNYHSKCWSKCDPDDFEAQLIALEFLISYSIGITAVDIVVIDHDPSQLH